MTERYIKEIVKSQNVVNDGQMKLRRALPLQQRESLGPFVFVDHYRSNSPRGIGDRPHPHAGIEVISYLMEGSGTHRDSLGRTDTLNGGESQFIKAGRGIIHSETPHSGRHGLQLWTNLPSKNKNDEPFYQSFREAELPKKDTDNGFIKVISGQVNDLKGPLPVTSPTTLAHIKVKPNQTYAAKVDPNEELGIYVIDGSVKLPSYDQPLEPGDLAVLSPGDQVTLIAGPNGADVAILGGEPIKEPLVFGGPFVMNDVAGLKKAEHDFLTGKMGTLDGVPF